MISPAHAEIGPATPSKAEIYRRANKVIEFARLAKERLDQDDITHALQWLDRARAECPTDKGTDHDR